MNTTLGIFAAIGAVAVFLWGLRRARAGRVPASLRPADGSDVLGFEIAAVPVVEPDSQAWLVRYGTAPATEFEIHLHAIEPAPGSPFAPGWVIFHRVSESGAGTFLSDLARALGLSQVASPGDAVSDLRCDASLMGWRLTKGPGPDMIAGSFTTRPAGDWIVGKIFFADGNGEMFLALNPVTGRGEFLSKDPEFSEPVIRELGRLFQSR